MIAEPAFTPVTTPALLTVATLVLLEDQLTALFVAADGKTVAVSCRVLPSTSDVVFGATETPDADITPVTSIFFIDWHLTLPRPVQLSYPTTALYPPFEPDTMSL